MAKEEVGTVEAILALSTKKFDSAYKRAFSGFRRGLSSMVNHTVKTLKWGTVAMSAYGAASVKAFSGFEDAIVRSAAVTTGAVGDMQRAMEEAALSMSRKSILTARELAEGYFALGQAGFNVTQSLKALPVVTDFAIASQVKLDTATRYLVRTLEGLGMASDNAVENMKQMERVSNAFTFAAIKTTAEINDFAVAMTHAAAPALRLVNKSMEEGTAVLMAFARAGIVGEEAGTLLWTSVRDLQRATLAARQEWIRLKIDVYDDGRMRNMADIFSDLEGKLSGMSDELKKVTLRMLGFQDRSLRGIQALMGFSEAMREDEKAMKALTKLTRDLAEKYMQSFQSAMKMLWHQVVDVSIAVGRRLAPVIRELAKDFERNQEKIKEWAENLAGHVADAIGHLRDFANYLLYDWRGALTTGLLVAQELFGAFGKSVLMVMEETFRVLVANIPAVFTRITAKNRAFHKMVSAELRGRFESGFRGDLKMAELKSDYPEHFDKLLKDIEDGVRKKLDARNFQKDFDEKYPLQPFVFDTEKFSGIWTEAEEKIKGIMGESTFGEFMEKEETMRGLRKGWEKIVKGMEGPVDKLEKIKSRLMDAFSFESKVDVKGGIAALEELQIPMEILRRNLADQVTLYGLTVNEMERYNKEIQIRNMYEEKIGSAFAENATALAYYTEEVQKHLDILDVINEKRHDFERFFDSSRQWAEDASYVWENLGEDMTRAFDGFADELTNALSGLEVDWKRFTASILQDWLRTIIRMQMAAIWTKTLQPALAGLGSALGLGGSGSIGATAALGKIFSAGNVVPMALGGILNQMAVLPMRNKRSALVAEQGPEAVMPLQRDRQGRLGVLAEAKTPPVVKTKIVNVFDRDEMYAAMQSEQGEEVTLNVLRRHGII